MLACQTDQFAEGQTCELLHHLRTFQTKQNVFFSQVLRRPSKYCTKFCELMEVS